MGNGSGVLSLPRAEGQTQSSGFPLQRDMSLFRFFISQRWTPKAERLTNLARVRVLLARGPRLLRYHKQTKTIKEKVA